jgi:NADH-quinone oxidoreductase subunit J
MTHPANVFQWILGCILILSSLGVILLRQPVHASLSFLLTLFAVAAFYIELSAEFIGVIQILVYAGAILVIFMFVIVLFQDAHLQIEEFRPQSSPLFLSIASALFLLTLIFFGKRLIGLNHIIRDKSSAWGSVQAIAETLYIDFMFPFEASIPLFLVALVGALYIGKRVK